MKQDVKAKWIDALRSGTYKQGQYALWNDSSNEYCCLGVLVNLLYPEGWKPRVKAAGTVDFDYKGNHCGGGYIPLVLAQELEMNGASISELVNMNDTKRSSFAEIADWIEANL